MTTQLIRLVAILLLVVAGCTGACNEGCRSCAGTESCEECVARCVDTQEVSPDVCRTTACASICSEGNR
jgi:hypothetical protein